MQLHLIIPLKEVIVNRYFNDGFNDQREFTLILEHIHRNKNNGIKCNCYQIWGLFTIVFRQLEY